MFKTVDIDTLEQDKKCQPCWYIVLSTMCGSTTTNKDEIVFYKIKHKQLGRKHDYKSIRKIILLLQKK